MESFQKYGLGISVISLMLLVVILGVYFVNDISKQNSQKLKTQAAEISPNLSIITPNPGDEIKDKGLLEAKFQTTKDISLLKGVFKVGNGPTLPLALVRLNASDILARGEFDTDTYPNGDHKIKIYIYENQGVKILSIAEAGFTIRINN